MGLGLECPGGLTIVVEGVIVGPAVVGLPGVVRALEEHIGFAVVGDDKDDVGLETTFQEGELAEVHPADPVFGDGDFTGC